jgi:hypothetical protein
MARPLSHIHELVPAAAKSRWGLVTLQFGWRILSGATIGSQNVK